MTDRLALPRRYRDQLEALLSKHVPGVEVWAYGSRVNGRSHEGSDLDLALRGPALEPLDGGFYDLLEAIEKSNIPILIQAHDWAMLPESFHREIERDYVVVQKGEIKSRDQLGEGSISRDWVTRRISELGRVITGKTPPTRDPDNFGGRYPFITIPDLDGRAAIDRTTRTLSDKGAETMKSSLLPPGSVLMSCIATVGKCGITTKPSFTNQQINSVIPDAKTDSRFLYYAFTQLGHDLDSAGGGGSVYTNVSKSRFSDIEISLPPLPTQRAIAHVVGTLDDKIELNRRMNETLEAMARALFKSWFVDFEPVRAKMEGRDTGLPPDVAALFPDRLVDSDLGEIPEGWEVKALGEFGEVITGKTPSTKQADYYGKDVPLLRIPDMHGRMYAVTTSSMLSHDGATSQPRQALPSGSISVSCIATPGLVILNHRRTHTNQQINSIVPNDMRASKYLYWSCRHIASVIMTGGSGGSVFYNMNKSTFSGLGILDAGMRAIGAFEDRVSSLHEMILSNEKQSQDLTALRDALLPKLVSGEVQVRDSECLLTGEAR